MKNITGYLQQLDFSELEAHIYIILLKSGPKTVAELAQAANINRTAAYAYINSLLQKGVIAKVKGEKSKIAANPPEDLHHLVEQKKHIAKSLELNLPLAIKSLNTILPQTKPDNTSEMRYYKGRTAVKSIYDDCLKSKYIRSYFNVTDLEKVFPKNFELFENKINNTPDMIVREFVENSPVVAETIEKFYKHNRYQYKLLPDNIKLTSNDILIYDGKVAIINIGDKQNISGVILKNQDYFNNSAQLFDLLWSLLPYPTP